MGLPSQSGRAGRDLTRDGFTLSPIGARISVSGLNLSAGTRGTRWGARIAGAGIRLRDDHGERKDERSPTKGYQRNVAVIAADVERRCYVNGRGGRGNQGRGIESDRYKLFSWKLPLEKSTRIFPFP